jgi:ribosomal protein S19
MKVLLISANTEQINMPVLPLGMAFVARAAEDAGHEVSQINLMAEPEALKTLAERIQQVQPDIIGIAVSVLWGFCFWAVQVKPGKLCWKASNL